MHFTENIDILPTVLDFLDGEIPRQCDGFSLMPFLKGSTLGKWRTEAHWEVDFRYFDEYPGVLPAKELRIDAEACSYNVIRDERYKYSIFPLCRLFFSTSNRTRMNFKIWQTILPTGGICLSMPKITFLAHGE